MDTLATIGDISRALRAKRDHEAEFSAALDQCIKDYQATIDNNSNYPKLRKSFGKLKEASHAIDCDKSDIVNAVSGMISDRP